MCLKHYAFCSTGSTFREGRVLLIWNLSLPSCLPWQGVEQSWCWIWGIPCFPGISNLTYPVTMVVMVSVAKSLIGLPFSPPEEPLCMCAHTHTHKEEEEWRRKTGRRRRRPRGWRVRWKSKSREILKKNPYSYEWTCVTFGITWARHIWKLRSSKSYVLRTLKFLPPSPKGKMQLTEWT